MQKGPGPKAGTSMALFYHIRYDPARNFLQLLPLTDPALQTPQDVGAYGKLNRMLGGICAASFTMPVDTDMFLPGLALLPRQAARSQQASV